MNVDNFCLRVVCRALVSVCSPVKCVSSFQKIPSVLLLPGSSSVLSVPQNTEINYKYPSAKEKITGRIRFTFGTKRRGAKNRT